MLVGVGKRLYLPTTIRLSCEETLLTHDSQAEGVGDDLATTVRLSATWSRKETTVLTHDSEVERVGDGRGRADLTCVQTSVSVLYKFHLQEGCDK